MKDTSTRKPKISNTKRFKLYESMKSETKAALLAIRENIEMELFSSEEGCIVIQTQEEKVEYTSNQVSRNLWKILDL